MLPLLPSAHSFTFKEEEIILFANKIIKHWKYNRLKNRSESKLHRFEVIVTPLSSREKTITVEMLIYSVKGEIIY